MESLPQDRLKQHRPRGHSPQAPPQAEGGSPRERPAILIVDDRPDNLLVLERLLQQTEAVVIKAQDGNEALKACLNHEFALALLDVNMPGMDGYELATLMRGEKSHSAMPIIFVTAAYREEEQIFKGYSAGAVDYLVKPLRPEILLNKVNVFLDLYRQKREIAYLNASLAARAEQLEAANRELESFNYTVSHDLRSPVLGIANFCRIILEKHEHTLDEKCRGYFKIIHAETMRMDQLINTLLNFSRMSRQEMKLEAVDLSAMARAVSQELRATAPERQVEFLIMEHLSCQGDRELLKVALTNLLGNAWKYSAKERMAMIEFGCAELAGSAPTFYVRDNGVGFDQNYAHKLFGLFQRLHSSDEFEGHGIGLVTVERVIRRHGGRVWAESEEGKGATFYFAFRGEEL